jgi:uncharacterized protein
MTADPRYGGTTAARTEDPRFGGQMSGRTNGRREWADLAVAEDHEGWVSRSRVFLTPIAAPSIMGLFGFMISTVMLGSWQAGWYGTRTTPLLIWPLAILAGGIMQAIAAVSSLRARDGVAVAVHTAWGSFWIAWGILQILVATGVIAAIPLGAASPSFAIWFVAIALVTFWGALGALAENLLLFITVSVLAAASAVTAAGFWAGSLAVTRAGGWLFVVSAAAAWLTAGAMVLEHAFERTIVPMGKWSRRANVPGGRAIDHIQYREGMPGVRAGQ